MSKTAWVVIRNTGYRVKDVKLSNSVRSSSVAYVAQTATEANKELYLLALRSHYMASPQLETHKVEINDDVPFGSWSNYEFDGGVDAIRNREEILDAIGIGKDGL